MKPNTDMFVFKWKNCHRFKKKLWSISFKLNEKIPESTTLLISQTHATWELSNTSLIQLTPNYVIMTHTHVHMHHMHMKISVSWLWMGKWPIFALFQWLQPVIYLQTFYLIRLYVITLKTKWQMHFCEHCKHCSLQNQESRLQ